MIFFDRASKGNPGISGAGGVIYTSGRQKKDNFSWGLGQSTNNQAEILGLLKACQLSQGNRGENLQVFGDLEILIKILNTGDQLNRSALNKSLEILRNLLQKFTTCSFYHILRTVNKEADIMANKRCLLAEGFLSKNDEATER